MNRWRIRKGRCEECHEDGYVIWMHTGQLYGCRPTHDEAVEFATRKARRWLNFLNRLPLNS